MNKRDHWENLYTAKPMTGVSWYREHLDRSLELIGAAKLPRDAAIIDVGGGASTLVDDLLDAGYKNLTVLDISSTAMDKTCERLGGRASAVT